MDRLIKALLAAVCILFAAIAILVVITKRKNEIPYALTAAVTVTAAQRDVTDTKYGSGIYIETESVLQLPELPTGCEITALTAYLRFLGFDAEKTNLAEDYLPKSGFPKERNGKYYVDSFFYNFVGDPFSRGYGCFSYAIVAAAEKYIADNGGGYDVINVSGSKPETLYGYIRNGIPVICWGTIDMREPVSCGEYWYDNTTRERLEWFNDEHCFVLTGYDIQSGTVTVNDPLAGIIERDISVFEERYVQMHSQAVIIVKEGTVQETRRASASHTAHETTTHTSRTQKTDG